MTVQNLLWLIVAGTAAIDVVLLIAQGMTVAVRWPTAAGVLLLYCLSIVYRHRSAKLAAVSLLATQLVAFSYVGAILTYLAMAATSRPMADDTLARADAALGFDWFLWFGLVSSHPKLKLLLALAYNSWPAQGLVLLGYQSVAEPKRAQEFLLAAMLSIIFITPLMVLLPAVGHHIALIEPWRSDILALRDHSMRQIDEMQGIVTFPSFHTALGVLFPTMYRGRKWFLPVLALNLLMIASVMTEGAHYAVDMLAGAAIAFLALAAARFMLARCASQGVIFQDGLAGALD
jgi:membrane-associated phospholipid phosphatase